MSERTAEAPTEAPITAPHDPAARPGHLLEPESSLPARRGGGAAVLRQVGARCAREVGEAGGGGTPWWEVVGGEGRAVAWGGGQRHGGRREGMEPARGGLCRPVWLGWKRLGREADLEHVPEWSPAPQRRPLARGQAGLFISVVPLLVL